MRYIYCENMHLQVAPLPTQPETRKLQQVSYHQADIRMCSHRLLYRLGASYELHACRLDAGFFINLQQVCKYQVAASLMFTDLMQLDEVNRLDANGNKNHAGLNWKDREFCRSKTTCLQVKKRTRASWATWNRNFLKRRYAQRFKESTFSSYCNFIDLSMN